MKEKIEEGGRGGGKKGREGEGREGGKDNYIDQTRACSARVWSNAYTWPVHPGMYNNWLL